MFDLVVQVTCEPVVEWTASNVAGRDCLRYGPVMLVVLVYFHGNMVALGDKQEPVALNEPGIIPQRVISVLQTFPSHQDIVHSFDESSFRYKTAKLWAILYCI